MSTQELPVLFKPSWQIQLKSPGVFSQLLSLGQLSMPASQVRKSYQTIHMNLFKNGLSQIVYLFRVSNLKPSSHSFISRQSLPLPSCPLLHVHNHAPAVLLHVALWWQSCVFSAHSSISSQLPTPIPVKPLLQGKRPRVSPTISATTTNKPINSRLRPVFVVCFYLAPESLEHIRNLTITLALPGQEHFWRSLLNSDQQRHFDGLECSLPFSLDLWKRTRT